MSCRFPPVRVTASATTETTVRVTGERAEEYVVQHDVDGTSELDPVQEDRGAFP